MNSVIHSKEFIKSEKAREFIQTLEDIGANFVVFSSIYGNSRAYITPALRTKLGLTIQQIFVTTATLLEACSFENADLSKKREHMSYSSSPFDSKETTLSAQDTSGVKRWFKLEGQFKKFTDESLKILLFIEITSLKQLEKANLMNTKLAALGLLASNISHEINNPLTVISLYLDKLGNTANLGKMLSVDDAKTMHTKCKEAMAKILHIMEAVSKVHGSRSSSYLQNQNLTTILEQCINSWVSKKSAFGIDFEFENNSGEMILQCNDVDISRVIEALLNNAFDAVRKNSNKMIKVILSKDSKESWATIKIIDNGPGISLDQREFLTVPFFTTKKFDQGTGLGLSVAQNILEKHNGKLTIDSTDCTIVTCYLPLVKSKMTQSA